jgi:hypothetical protein
MILACSRVGNPHTDISAGNEVRAVLVDIGVPAKKLINGESILALGDYVPAGVTNLNLIKKVAFLFYILAS